MNHLRQKSNQAFTLIELLVVISIIALLSSVVLAAVGTARQRGYVAAAQTFDGHTYTALFDDLRLEWNFDNDSGTTAQDQSGNGNNLNLTGGATLVSTPNPFNQGKVLSITSSQTAIMPTTFNNPPAGDFSVSFWLNASDSANAYNFLSNFSGVANQSFNFDPHDASSGMIFDFRTNGSTVSAIAGPFQANQWYQYVGVCSSASSKIGVYVNGRLAGSASLPSGGTCSISSNPIKIAGATSYYVDNVRVYQRALPVSEIQGNYFAELKGIKSLALKK